MVTPDSARGGLLQDDEGGNHLIGLVEFRSLAELLNALGQLALQQIDLGDIDPLGDPFALGLGFRLRLDGIAQGGDLHRLTLFVLDGCGGVLTGNIVVLAGVQCTNAGNSHVHNQTQCQQHRQHALEIHVCSSFCFSAPGPQDGAQQIRG